jgi:hypothetical protein
MMILEGWDDGVPELSRESGSGTPIPRKSSFPQARTIENSVSLETEGLPKKSQMIRLEEKMDLSSVLAPR